MKRFVSLRSIFVSAWLLSSIMGVMSPGPSAENMLHAPIQAGIVDFAKTQWIKAQIAYKSTHLKAKYVLWFNAVKNCAEHIKENWTSLINPFSDPDETLRALKEKADEHKKGIDELEKEIDELKAELKALEKEQD